MANPKIVFDDFIKNVRPDAKSTEAVVFLSGWIGESPREGHVRVYFDMGLSQFTDVLKSDILHAVPNTKEESSSGGSKLWVRQPVPSMAAQAPQAAAANSFLEGDVYNAYANQMYRPAGLPGPIPPTRWFFCPPPPPPPPHSHWFYCPKPTLHSPQTHCSPCLQSVIRSLCCPVSTPFVCVTALAHCTITQPAICQIQTSFGICNFPTRDCGSVVDACPTAPTDTTIYQRNPGIYVNPQYGFGAFNPHVQPGYGY